jgi:RNA polymerase sigma factor (sigma-70 family)
MNAPDDGSTRLSLVNGLLDAGNRAVWKRFCANFGPRLRAACARLGVRKDDLDDVVAEVFLRVAGAMLDGWVYDPVQSFRGWLTTICRNEASRHLRQKNGHAARGGVGTGDSDVHALLDAEPAPETDEVEAAWAETLREAARRVQARVDPRQWDCFALNGVERLPAAAVAGRVGVSVAAVWQNKHRVAKLIRAEIRRQLGDAGPAEEE